MGKKDFMSFATTTEALPIFRREPAVNKRQVQYTLAELAEQANAGETTDMTHLSDQDYLKHIRSLYNK